MTYNVAQAPPSPFKDESRLGRVDLNQKELHKLLQRKRSVSTVFRCKVTVYVTPYKLVTRGTEIPLVQRNIPLLGDENPVTRGGISVAPRLKILVCAKP